VRICYSCVENTFGLIFSEHYSNFIIVGRCDCRRPTTGSDDLITWSRYTRADRRYLRLSTEGSTMMSHLRADHVAFWNRLIPTMLAHREEWMASRSWRESFAVLTAALWTLAAVCVVLLLIITVLGVLQVRHSMLAKRRKKGTAVGGGPSAAGRKQARV